jgi:hypothetical protein
MKHLFKTVLLFCILFHTNIQSFSQNITFLTGNLKFLKDQKSILVIYDYRDMHVGNMTEENYIKKKLDSYKEKPGKGENWLAAWKNDRIQYFQPAFETNVNNHIGPVFLNPSDSNSTYTLRVKTTFTEPGFRVYRGIKEDASITLTYTFINTQTHEVMAVLSSFQVRCRYNSYDVMSRIKSAYAHSGAILGKYIANVRKNDYVIQ